MVPEDLDQDESVAGVFFLDFSEDCYIVCQNIYCKMDDYGICGVEWECLEDYSSNRMTSTTYNRHKSAQIQNYCDLPYGSIFVPILILLYINDLANVSEPCFSVLFAYDTNICITGRYLRNVLEWLQCNRHARSS